MMSQVERSPVEIICQRNPLMKENIDYMSHKWAVRWGVIAKWPEEGTFDLQTCATLGMMVENYKPQGNAKSVRRREVEMLILNLFKQEGEDRKQEAVRIQREERGGSCLLSAIVQEQTEGAVGGADEDVVPQVVRTKVKGQKVWTREVKSDAAEEDSLKETERLLAILPKITLGAVRWIRIFEEQTLGKVITVGSMKALFARVMGIDQLTAMLETANLGHFMFGRQDDGLRFDPYQKQVWALLRLEYPFVIDLSTLTGRKITDTEDPAEDVASIHRLWREHTDVDPAEDPVMGTIFRGVVLEGLPAEIRHAVQEMIWVETYMTHATFTSNVIHAMNRYREANQRRIDQSVEVRRRFEQLSLEELMKRRRQKKTVRRSPAGGFMGGNVRQGRSQGRGRSQDQQGQRNDVQCWVCGRLGHTSRGCRP